MNSIDFQTEVGKIYYEKHRKEQIKDNLMNSEFEVIYLNEQPIEICYAEEIGFICTNTDSITIFTGNINNILNKNIPWTGAYGCAINKNNDIFISDKVLNHVYKMRYCDDFKLKTQGKFGATGSRNEDLNSPRGIALSSIICL
jgi:hypothetical protein